MYCNNVKSVKLFHPASFPQPLNASSNAQWQSKSVNKDLPYLPASFFLYVRGEKYKYLFMCHPSKGESRVFFWFGTSFNSGSGMCRCRRLHQRTDLFHLTGASVIFFEWGSARFTYSTALNSSVVLTSPVSSSKVNGFINVNLRHIKGESVVTSSGTLPVLPLSLFASVYYFTVNGHWSLTMDN